MSNPLIGLRLMAEIRPAKADDPDSRPIVALGIVSMTDREYLNPVLLEARQALTPRQYSDLNTMMLRLWGIAFKAWAEKEAQLVVQPTVADKIAEALAQPVKVAKSGTVH